MNIIMFFLAPGPDGTIEQKMHNWRTKRYRGDLMYGLTHFKENSISYIIPQFKKLRSIEIKSWLPNLIDIIKDKRHYDIIYTPYREGLEALIYLRALRIYRKKVVVWQHQVIEKPGGFIRTLLYRIFLNGIDKFIFTNETGQIESIQSGYIPKHKTEVLKWGADLDFFNTLINEASGKEYIDVRFISTGIDHRDFETLVKAFKGLPQILDLYLTEKELYDKYKDAAENIIVHYVEREGSLESSLLSSYTVGLELAKSSVAIICSKPVSDRKMSLGLTSIVEATALGKPVIITRNKYLPNYCEENNIGLFINPYDVDELREAVTRISNDSQLRKKLGENSRQFALTKCNLELFTKDLATLFASI